MFADPAAPRTSSSITFPKWCNITPTRPTTICQRTASRLCPYAQQIRVHSDNALMILSRSSSYLLLVL